MAHLPPNDRGSGHPDPTRRRWLRAAAVSVAGALALALALAGCTSTDDAPNSEPPDDVGSSNEDGSSDDDPSDEEPGRTLDVDGPDEGAVVNADQLEDLRFSVTASGAEATVEDLAVHLDGVDVTHAAQVEATSIVYEPGQLDDGSYTVEIVIPGEDDGTDAMDDDADGDGADATDDDADGDGEDATDDGPEGTPDDEADDDADGTPNDDVTDAASDDTATDGAATNDDAMDDDGDEANAADDPDGDEDDTDAADDAADDGNTTDAPDGGAEGADGTDGTNGDASSDRTTVAEVVHSWSFEVDATPPTIELTSPDGAVVADEPVTVAGTTEPGSAVSVDDQQVEAGEDGGFELELDAPPDGGFEVVAVDEAGNRSHHEAAQLVTVPSRVGLDEIRGVHVTPHAWAHPDFRERVLGMVDDGLINTIQLDLKDEGGRIGYDTDVELAIESGAAENVYSLEDAVAELHDRGIHIVGRIVAFRDPVLGQYAQDNGTMDWLIQRPDGQPYTGRYPCCFTSFANDDVIEYHLDIAEEAAAAGVDDILWDYIRRPDGSPDNMVVPGVSDDADGATLEEAVVEFAARADERLAPYGVGHGASLYGIAADRPTEIAQDVPAMAEHLDYVSPMIYPSHWGPGEYGVDEPIRQPYDIITETLEVWKEATEGTNTRIVPWLEDTTYRAWDRPHQVREQIRAAKDHDIDEWLMWDPRVDYTLEAYDPRED